MELTFRWFGNEDPIPLDYVRQIPGVRGVVSALYDFPIGEPWPRDELAQLAERIEAAGMRFAHAPLAGAFEGWS